MENILILINDYQETVKIGVEQFKKQFNTNQLLTDWMDRKFPQEGTLTTGTSFYFHGIGCLFTIDGVDVDVDFGPNNRYDGFDLWRLGCFVEEKKETYEIYAKNKEFLANDFNRLASENIIVKPDWWPGSTLYYFKNKV